MDQIISRVLAKLLITVGPMDENENPRVISHVPENKFELLSNNQDLPNLSFQDLQDCLQNAADIKTSNWKLIKKQ